MRRLGTLFIHATAVLAFLAGSLGHLSLVVERAADTTTPLGKWAWAGAYWTSGHTGVLWAFQLYFLGWLVWVLTASWRREHLGMWRHRQRRGHCMACGYDLTGNVSGVCPECGATAKPAGAGACTSCGYDLTGNVSGVCPECGTATAARATALDRAVQLRRARAGSEIV